MTFTAPVRKFDHGLWSFHIRVPDDIYNRLTSDGEKRVMCRINEEEPFHAGLMPDGEGHYFVKLNKPRMKAFGLYEGLEVKVNLEKDHSKYGMPMPPEFEEVLHQDPEGEAHFEALTAGKKRSLIYMVQTVKSPDKRIGKALVILDHLKVNDGKLDFKALNAAMKNSPL